VAACAGAWLGEAKPALLIADSGFLVATWPLASLAVSYDIPMRRSAILRRLGERRNGSSGLSFCIYDYRTSAHIGV
jgi:sulfopyruvate decarboxylase TPP-binding subunit